MSDVMSDVDMDESLDLVSVFKLKTLQTQGSESLGLISVSKLLTGNLYPVYSQHKLPFHIKIHSISDYLN